MTEKERMLSEARTISGSVDATDSCFLAEYRSVIFP
jgi:hypothetical protein